MVAPIRQIVTVGVGGLIEIRASQLSPGSRAEVTVTPVVSDAKASLAALDALQASLHLDRSKAQAWANRVTEERQSFPRG